MTVTKKGLKRLLESYISGNFDDSTRLVATYPVDNSNNKKAKQAERLIANCIKDCTIYKVISGSYAGLFDLILINEDFECYHLMQNSDASRNIIVELHHIIFSQDDFD